MQIVERHAHLPRREPRAAFGAARMRNAVQAASTGGAGAVVAVQRDRPALAGDVLADQRAGAVRGHLNPGRIAAARKRVERPLDRIGQLTMRNLDIADSREKLSVYAKAGVLNIDGGAELGLLEMEKKARPEMPPASQDGDEWITDLEG